MGVPEQTVNVWQSVRSENKMMPEMMEGPEPPGFAPVPSRRADLELNRFLLSCKPLLQTWACRACAAGAVWALSIEVEWP